MSIHETVGEGRTSSDAVGMKRKRASAPSTPTEGTMDDERRMIKVRRMSPGAKDMKKGAWSPTEDAFLTELIRKEQGGKIHSLIGGRTRDFPWRRIASMIEGRNVKQVRERWRNYLDPDVNTGPWTAEEDAELLRCAELYRMSWTKVSKAIRGRSVNRVKTRWMHLFRTHQRAKPWAEDEDKLILEMKGENKKWGEISGQLPYRCTKVIRERFMYLTNTRLAALEMAAWDEISPQSSGTAKSPELNCN